MPREGAAPVPGGLLFAYGTLMRGAGGPWSGRLEALGAPLGRGSVAGRLFLVSWYPGMLEADGPGQRVRGEVWRLADPGRAWPQLDEFEGVVPGRPDLSLYRRVVVDVALDGGTALACQAYLFNRPTDGLEPIPSGDFRDVRPLCRTREMRPQALDG